MYVSVPSLEHFVSLRLNNLVLRGQCEVIFTPETPVFRRESELAFDLCKHGHACERVDGRDNNHGKTRLTRYICV